MHIASAKISEREGSIHHPVFMGSRPTTSHMVFSRAYQADEFSFMEMKTWAYSKIPSYCFVFGVKQEN